MPYYDKNGKPKFYGRLTEKVGASLNNVNARKSGVAAYKAAANGKPLNGQCRAKFQKQSL